MSIEYIYTKYNNKDYDVGELRVIVGCTQCRYVELCQAESNTLDSIFDFFIG